MDFTYQFVLPLFKMTLSSSSIMISDISLNLVRFNIFCTFYSRHSPDLWDDINSLNNLKWFKSQNWKEWCIVPWTNSFLTMVILGLFLLVPWIFSMIAWMRSEGWRWHAYLWYKIHDRYLICSIWLLTALLLNIYWGCHTYYLQLEFFNCCIIIL